MLIDFDNAIKIIKNHKSHDTKIICKALNVIIESKLFDLAESKPPLLKILDEDVSYYACPNCKLNILVLPHDNYCSECGQKLDWSVISDDKKDIK